MKYRFLLRLRLVCVAFVLVFFATWSEVGQAQYLYWTGFETRPTDPNVLRAGYDGAVEKLVRAGGGSAGIAIHDEHLYLSSRLSGTSTILRSTLNGAESTPLFSTASTIRGLGFDRVADRLYFHDESAQRFVSLSENGGDFEQGIATGSSDWVRSLAVDGVNRMLYWTQLDSLWRAPLDGGPKQLLAGPNSELELVVHSVALDLKRGHMYWTEWHDDEENPFLQGGRVRRANLDGSDVHTIVSGLSPEEEPEGYRSAIFNSTYLAIDPIANVMFTYNEALADISRANLDGSELDEHFISSQGVDTFGGMAIYAAIPEPSSYVLMAIGVGLLFSVRRCAIRY